MSDTDAFYTTGCGNCACSRAAVVHAGGCPMVLRSESTKPVPVEMIREWRKVLWPAGPYFIERCLPIYLLVLALGWAVVLLALLAHHLGWV